MKSFQISITKRGSLSIICPDCGSTQVEITNYPINEVDKIKCRHCGCTVYRPLPQPKGYHQITMDELSDYSEDTNEV